MGATETVARWIVNTSYEDIPPDAISVANESCFDLLGVILAGSTEQVGEIIRQFVADQGGNPEATVLASGQRTSLANAALVNGTMGHALDYDDFGGFGHPTVAIFPGLLALGEGIGATGRDLLEAYVIGCEVGLALQHATKYKQMQNGFHGTAVIGRMAGAAACAKLLKLDEQQTVAALGIAGSMASGLIHNFGTMAKPLHAGLTCRDGVMAAQLAQQGLTSGDRIIEDPYGFIATVLRGDGEAANAMAEGLGNPYRVQDALIIKKYPSCGGNHAILDSLFSLMREHNFGYQDVASADFDQHYTSVVMQEPDTPLHGKFSVAYNVAAGLVDGEVGVETFRDEKIAQKEILETMEKVHPRVLARSQTASDDLLAEMPVKITLKDGRVLQHATHRTQVLGGQNNPWGFENIKNKFQANARMALADAEAEEAIAAWSDIPQVTDVAGTIRRTLVKG